MDKITYTNFRPCNFVKVNQEYELSQVNFLRLFQLQCTDSGLFREVYENLAVGGFLLMGRFLQSIYLTDSSYVQVLLDSWLFASASLAQMES